VTSVNLSNGLSSFEIVDIPKAIGEVINGNRTPLLIDPSPEQVARTFYSYKAMLEDVSSLTIPFAKAGIKRSDLLDRCRKTLVGAMKSGTTFVLYLGAASIEHADWKKKLCKKDVFPITVFQNAGRKLLEPILDPQYKLLYREEDLEAGGWLFLVCIFPK